MKDWKYYSVSGKRDEYGMQVTVAAKNKKSVEKKFSPKKHFIDELSANDAFDDMGVSRVDSIPAIKKSTKDLVLLFTTGLIPA